MTARRAGLAAAFLLLPGAGVLGGRPLAVDDADAVAPGAAEVEAGAAFEQGLGYDHWDFPAGLTLGVRPGLELAVGYGGQIERKDGEPDDAGRRSSLRESDCTDVALSAKWQFAGAGGGIRHALAPAVKIPAADPDKGLGSGEADYDLTWIASAALGERIGLHLAAGYTWIGDMRDEDLSDLFHGGVAVDGQAGGHLQLVAEVVVEQEVETGAAALLLGSAGLRWTPGGAATFDLAAGGTLAGEGPDFFTTMGVTWALGARA